MGMLDVTSYQMPSMQSVESMNNQMMSQMNNNSSPSQSSMSQMSGALQSLSQELLNMMSTAMMAQAMKDRDKLLDMANDALDLAQWQNNISEMPSKGDQKQKVLNQQALKQALQNLMKQLDFGK